MNTNINTEITFININLLGGHSARPTNQRTSHGIIIIIECIGHGAWVNERTFGLPRHKLGSTERILIANSNYIFGLIRIYW